MDRPISHTSFQLPGAKYLVSGISRLVSHISCLVYVSLLASCSGGGQNAQQQAPAPGAVPVEVVQVNRERVTTRDRYPGMVVALKETELRAEVSGYITGIFAEEGQTVAKGQKLYEIDNTRYQAAYDQAQASLEIARANYEKVKRDVERYQTLLERDAIARQTVDYALTDLSNAEAQVKTARAQVTNAATDLQRSQITAPYTGTIGISQVRQGALVTAGTTLLNTLSSDDPIGVDFPVNEEDIARFIQLQKAGGTAGDSAVITLQLPGGKNYSAAGRIQTIDRAVRPGTGTITVRASFPNPERRLRVGMNTNVLVLNPDAGEQLVIPYKSVTDQLSDSYVFVVNDSNKVAQRIVELGSQVADKIVVREGLKAGETIVSEGVQNLRDGASVSYE